MRIIVLVCMLSFLVFGCAQRAVVAPEDETKDTTKEETTETAKTETMTKEEVVTEDTMMNKEPSSHAPDSGMVRDALAAGGAFSLFSVAPDGTKFTNVYFDFDKYYVKDEFRPVLMKLSDWLIDNNAVMLIGGHCDERGTNEYNLALGDRRARSVMDFLLASGVPSRKLEAISHGEEKPVCNDSVESCWWKNRRAQFSFGMK
ncbi:OmpA family protein [Nitrospirota bacterium]